jgi:hypothetical protein
MTTPTKYLATTTAVTVHPEGQNFSYAEDITTLRMVDESGGAFFLISQNDGKPLRMDLQEMELMVEEARKLLAQPGVEGVGP